MNVQEHLLTILAEECAEVAHATAKALRFGLADVNPNNPDSTATARDVLVTELNDLFAVVELLQEAGVELPNLHMKSAIRLKKEKVRRMMAHAERLGTLTP